MLQFATARTQLVVLPCALCVPYGQQCSELHSCWKSRRRSLSSLVSTAPSCHHYLPNLQKYTGNGKHRAAKTVISVKMVTAPSEGSLSLPGVGCGVAEATGTDGEGNQIGESLLLPTLLHFQLPLGHCVGVRIPHDDITKAAAKSELPLQEVEYCSSLPVGLQANYLGGRLAFRRALAGQLQDLQGSPSSPSRSGLLSKSNTDVKAMLASLGALRKDEFGAPVLPDGVAGSISHKGTVAVAIAALDIDGNIGIDLESLSVKRRVDLKKRVLTEQERASLTNNNGTWNGKGGRGVVVVAAATVDDDGDGNNTTMVAALEEKEDVLMRFSAKEALYKALHPFLRRNISFQEAEIYPQAGGSLDVRLILNSDADPGVGKSRRLEECEEQLRTKGSGSEDDDGQPFQVQGMWMRVLDDMVLTWVHVRRRRIDTDDEDDAG